LVRAAGSRSVPVEERSGVRNLRRVFLRVVERSLQPLRFFGHRDFRSLDDGLAGSKHHDGRGAMGQDAAVRGDQPCFRRHDLPPLGYHPALGADASGVGRYGTGKIGLGLDGGVADSGGQQGVTGTASGAVDQGKCPPAMDRTHRIEEIGVGRTLEDSEAVADFDQGERHGLRNRRRREAAVDHSLEQLLASHGCGGGLVRIRHHRCLETVVGTILGTIHGTIHADCWLGDLVNTISNTSRQAPTTIALSATLKAGHWCGPI